MTGVVIVTAETGDAAGTTAWHTVDLRRRLADAGLDPIVVTWFDHPLGALLAAEGETWTPADLGAAPSLVALRKVGLGTLASRAKDVLFRRWLRGHRDRAVLLDGAAAGIAMPWFARHPCPVIWQLHEGDAGAASGLGLGGGDLGAADHIVTADAAAGAWLTGLGRTSGVTLGPPHHPLAPAPRATTATLGVLGPVDERHGADLLPRLLWHLDRHFSSASRSGAPPVSARWGTTGTAELTPSCRHDLRHQGMTGRLTVEVVDDLQAFLPGIVGLVLPWREGAVDGLARRAAAVGRPTVAFEPADRHAGSFATTTPFADLAAMAGHIAGWFADAPVALDAAEAASQAMAAATEHLISLLRP